MLEMAVKLFALGLRGYLDDRWNWLDGFIVGAAQPHSTTPHMCATRSPAPRFQLRPNQLTPVWRAVVSLVSLFDFLPQANTYRPRAPACQQ